jgi:oligoendopeptidase F
MDAKWAELGRRFLPWIDWSGLREEEALGWRQHWALFSGPFYEVAYILANLGALQLWAASARDPDGTWQRYRSALSWGSTLPLATLYRTAGAELPISSDTVRSIVLSAASHF